MVAAQAPGPGPHHGRLEREIVADRDEREGVTGVVVDEPEARLFGQQPVGRGKSFPLCVGPGSHDDPQGVVERGPKQQLVPVPGSSVFVTREEGG